MNPLTPDADTVAPRSILFIGGTGVISAAAAERAVALGHRLTILNRGRSTRPVPDGAEILTADVRDASAVRAVLAGREFDAVADFITFTADQAHASLDLLAGRTGQYVFISSASAYQKPPTRLPILESTPLKNPFWQYSRDKIACEELFYKAYREQDFPLTVGESYTITSDEYLPWNQIYQLFARAAGVPEPELVHVSSETIAAHSAELGANLLGDRSHSVVFDNTKIKSLVPGYNATIPFADGARQIVQWFDANPRLQTVDQDYMALSDRLIAWVRSGA